MIVLKIIVILIIVIQKIVSLMKAYILKNMQVAVNKFILVVVVEVVVEIVVNTTQCRSRSSVIVFH